MDFYKSDALLGILLIKVNGGGGYPILLRSNFLSI